MKVINVCVREPEKNVEKAREKNWRYKGKEAYFTAFSELREKIGPSKCKLILKNISSMKNVWCLWSKTDPQGLICCLYFKAFMSDLSMRKITFIDHHLLIKLFVFSLLCFLNDYS